MDAARRTIEFTNAVLAGLARDGRDLVVHLQGVVVRDRGSVDVPATVLRQDAEVRIANATVVGEQPVYAQIVTASVWLVGEARHRDAVPLPQIHRGAVRIHFECGDGARLALRGAGVTVLLRGTQVALTGSDERRTH